VVLHIQLTCAKLHQHPQISRPNPLFQPFYGSSDPCLTPASLPGVLVCVTWTPTMALTPTPPSQLLCRDRARHEHWWGSIVTLLPRASLCVPLDSAWGLGEADPCRDIPVCCVFCASRYDTPIDPACYSLIIQFNQRCSVNNHSFLFCGPEGTHPPPKLPRPGTPTRLSRADDVFWQPHQST
jgi:hypothetical protein